MRKFEKDDRVLYKNVLGEIREGVVLKENKASVRLRDDLKVVSILKKFIWGS